MFGAARIGMFVAALLVGILTDFLAGCPAGDGGFARAQERMQEKAPARVQEPAQEHVQERAQEPAADKPAGAEGADPLIGSWELSNADHDKVCHLTFRADPVPGGRKLEIDRNCANLFPSTRDVTAWSMDNFGNLRLINSRGAAAVELAVAEAGIFDGIQPGEGRYILQSSAAAPVRSSEQLLGDWGIARGTGKPICILTLSGDSAGGDAMVVRAKPGCDTFVARFGPAAWRIDRGELVLSSARGQTWRFEEDDANTWLRVPESADPVLLVRQ
jgi:hypothetical protein